MINFLVDTLITTFALLNASYINIFTFRIHGANKFLPCTFNSFGNTF